MRYLKERAAIPEPPTILEPKKARFGKRKEVLPPTILIGPQELRKRLVPQEKERALREARELVGGAAEIETLLISALSSAAMREQGIEAVGQILKRFAHKQELYDNYVKSIKLRERKDADMTTLDRVEREINNNLAQGKITKKEAQRLLNKAFKSAASSGELIVRNEVDVLVLKGKDNREKKAIWKPRDGEPIVKREGFEQGMYDIEPKTQCLREWFARLIAEAASKGKFEPIVPETVIREIGGRAGSTQRFLEDSVVAERTFKKFGFDWTEANQEHLQLIAAFDYILEMRDGHTSNFMVNKNGEIKAIDRALILMPDVLKSNLPPEKFILSYPLRLVRDRKIFPRVREQLEALREPKIQEVLKKAAKFSLGRDAEKLFNRMMKNLDNLLAKDERGASHFPHYELPNLEDEEIFKAKEKNVEAPSTFIIR